MLDMISSRELFKILCQLETSHYMLRSQFNNLNTIDNIQLLFIKIKNNLNLNLSVGNISFLKEIFFTKYSSKNLMKSRKMIENYNSLKKGEYAILSMKKYIEESIEMKKEIDDNFKLLDLSLYMDHRGRGAEKFSGTDNPSRAYSGKLTMKGYDKRRFAKLKGETILSPVSKPGKDDDKGPPEVVYSDDENEGEDDTFGDEDAKRKKEADKKKAAELDEKTKKTAAERNSG